MSITLPPPCPARSSLSRLHSGTQHVPLLGSVTDYMYGLLEIYTQYYTYTSGSG